MSAEVSEGVGRGVVGIWMRVSLERFSGGVVFGMMGADISLLGRRLLRSKKFEGLVAGWLGLSTVSVRRCYGQLTYSLLEVGLKVRLWASKEVRCSLNSAKSMRL